MERPRVGGGRVDRLRPHRVVDDRSHPQTRRATSTRTRATFTVSEMLTHSSSSVGAGPTGAVHDGGYAGRRDERGVCPVARTPRSPAASPSVPATDTETSPTISASGEISTDSRTSSVRREATSPSSAARHASSSASSSASTSAPLSPGQRAALDADARNALDSSTAPRRPDRRPWTGRASEEWVATRLERRVELAERRRESARP